MRIESVCPSVKLIYLVRDPIERTISHYRGSRRDGREQQSFEAAVADVDTRNYVLTSRYHFQLQRYLERFSGEDLLVVTAEELDSAPTSTLRTIYRFLDVDPAFENQRVGRRFNDSVGKTKLAPWTRWLSRRVPQPLKDWARPYLPLRWLSGERVPRPEVSATVRARLAEAFRPDVEVLQNLTGHDFNAWSV